jgi:hypothetical protein
MAKIRVLADIVIKTHFISTGIEDAATPHIKHILLIAPINIYIKSLL